MMSVSKKLHHKNWSYSRETHKIASLAQLFSEEAPRIFLKILKEPLMTEFTFIDH
jgi:hypothetical protein